jgi:hypothetical protein
MVPLSRKRTHHEEDYDISNGHDLEKSISYSSDEYETDSDEYSPASSHDGYDSRDAMLPQARARSRSYPQPRQPTSPSRRYQIPHRIMRWLCIGLMTTILVFILSLWRMSALSETHLKQAMLERPTPPPVWESFEFLERYYGGLKTLVGKTDNVPEFPREGGVPRKSNETGSTTMAKIGEWPVSQPISIANKSSGISDCFLDADDNIPIPDLHAYHGRVQGMPEAVVGSHEAIGLDAEMCFDRYGRLGPHGYGYSLRKGGIGAGLDGERQGAETVWKGASPINYKNIKWGLAQERCLEKNKHRFSTQSVSTGKAGNAKRAQNNTLAQPLDGTIKDEPQVDKVPRTAIILRTWRDFDYTPEVIVHLRSLVSELALISGGQYTVHFLIHIKDESLPIWADEAAYNQTLQDALPSEFAGMGTLWSEKQMGLIYSGLGESFYRDLPVHGVYRSAHLPLQWFAHNHPEYAFFWNWEMDVRYTGHWHKLFSALSNFADAQPRKGLWERNARYYVPSIHGSWEDFVHTSRVQSEMPAPQTNSKWANAGPPDAEAPPTEEPPVWGPLASDDTTPLDTDPLPPKAADKEWGLGEAADLITLNPIFDPARTSWVLAEDVTGYNTSDSFPPRRASIITTSRMSRRLLETMHVETAIHKHTMFSEMFPATMALHHGLKAVYAPHPVYIDRDWPTAYLAKVLNGGFNGAAGGSRTSVYGLALEHNLKGVSWYYNAGFPGNLWRRWLGRRVDGGGGEVEEVGGEGRMCLPPMLLHPVKDVDLVVEEV